MLFKGQLKSLKIVLHVHPLRESLGPCPGDGGNVPPPSFLAPGLWSATLESTGSLFRLWKKVTQLEGAPE